jgi:prevent-host-death family protein
MADRARVGIRELRQNLSVYVRRVKAGETLEVTEQNQPVALLAPLPKEPMSARDRLIAEGRLIPGKGDLMEALKNVEPIKLAPGEKAISEKLIEMRDEERY